jgi:hypothetical protein
MNVYCSRMKVEADFSATTNISNVLNSDISYWIAHLVEFTLLHLLIWTQDNVLLFSLTNS